jgi:hypothetical protein
MMHFLYPCFTMTPARRLDAGCSTVATVPIDDNHAMEWRFSYAPPRTGSGGRDARNSANPAADPYLPNGSGPLERHRYAKGWDNDFEIDREVQRTDKRTVQGYTGMIQISVQDRALTLSQGVSVDRTIERLGTTDAAIIRTRELLIKAATDLHEKNIVPPGVDKPEIYRQRSGWFIAPRDVDWFEFTDELRHGYQTELDEQKAAGTGVGD